MCQEPNDLDDDDWDDDDWDEDDLDWDDEWDRPQEERGMASRFGLISVIYRHENDEQPWLVQDNRKALKNEFPCSAKADVLDKIAQILDDICNPQANWTRTVTLPRSRWR